MDPNAPTWNPAGGGGGGQNYNNYNQQMQQNQYAQQQQYGYQNANQYQQTYQQQQPQQYMYQQQPQQQYYNAQQQQQPQQQQYYNQTQGYNQYNQGYAQNYQQQHQQQNQQYNRRYQDNPNNYNNNNNNSNYGNNPNNYNNNNNNYNNNRSQYDRNRNRNEYDRNQYNRSNDYQNQNQSQQVQNRFDRMHLNAEPQQQQQPAPVQQQQAPQQQAQPQAPAQTAPDAVNAVLQAAAPAPAAATTNFDDESDDGKPSQQQGAAGGGKKKKRKKRKKKGGNAAQDAAAPAAETAPAAAASNEANKASAPAETGETPAAAAAEPAQKAAKGETSEAAASGASSSASSEVVSEKVEKETKAEPQAKTKSKSTPKAAEEEEKASAPPAKKSKKSKKKSAKADVNVHDEREHVNLVLIGHVDAGKSTLSGQVLLQTGQIDERTIQKFEREAKERNRESWWIAYIMDEDDEERAKGKTVECGRAHFETASKRYTILDAPGHKNYVPNMISGASQADVALLVISARTGEFEAGFNRGGQTREHAILAYTLGIARVVIVVNKMDTCDWDAERFDTIEKKVRAFLCDIGFKSKYIDCVPVSGQSGINVSPDKRLDANTCKWWVQRKDGKKTLMETLDALKKLKRSSSGALRIPVLDRYKGDKGLQAIGKIEAGHVSVGDALTVMPTNTQCKVAALCIDDVEVESAVAGENILISFESQKTSLSLDNIFGGCVLCSQDSLCPLVTRFRAMIALQEELPNNGIVTKGYTAVFHCHNVSQVCEIVALRHLLRKDGKRSVKPPPFLRKKQNAVVDIVLQGASVAVEAYSDFAQLGRFTLRDSGQTVAIGKIESILGEEGEDGEESKSKQ